jgi:hypothetical protein
MNSLGSDYIDGSCLFIKVKPKKNSKKHKKAAKAVEELLNYYIKNHTDDLWMRMITSYKNSIVYGKGELNV